MRCNLTGSFLSAFFLLISVGCKEPFSPKGPFEQRLVAYSVLTAQSDTQYVRVYLNYNPPGFDPYAATGDRSDTSARVTISGAGDTVSFHDTLIIPLDQSRFTTLHAFVSRLFRPQPSTEYTLTVASSTYGTVTANSKMPGRGDLSIVDMSKLLFPDKFPNSTVDVDVVLDPGTKGFILRFVIVPALENDSTFTAETEVPVTYTQNVSGTWIPVFGRLSRVTSLHTRVSFSVRNYQQVLDDNLARYGSKEYCRWAKFYLIQVNEGLYNYVNVANGFQDAYSIRMDQPDYTNMQNGFGVFGSFNVDTLSIDFLKPVL